MNQRHWQVIDYLREENRVLREQLLILSSSGKANNLLDAGHTRAPWPLPPADGAHEPKKSAMAGFASGEPVISRKIDFPSAAGSLTTIHAAPMVTTFLRIEIPQRYPLGGNDVRFAEFSLTPHPPV
jgi:hypothetical protein